MNSHMDRGNGVPEAGTDLILLLVLKLDWLTMFIGRQI